MVHEEVTEACLPRRESRQAATSDQHQHQGNRSMVVPIKAGDLLTWRDLAKKEVGFPEAPDIALLHPDSHQIIRQEVEMG